MTQPEATTAASIETYLQGEQARKAIAQLKIHFDDGRDQTMMNAPEYGGIWRIAETGPWFSVTLSNRPHLPPVATCYYRPEGHRFLVTDLGRGVLDLRLRTGQMWSWGKDLHSLIPVGVDLCDRSVACKVNVAGEALANAHILPEAICSVLLASFRIASLEIK